MLFLLGCFAARGCYGRRRALILIKEGAHYNYVDQYKYGYVHAYMYTGLVVSFIVVEEELARSSYSFIRLFVHLVLLIP